MQYQDYYGASHAQVFVSIKRVFISTLPSLVYLNGIALRIYCCVFMQTEFTSNTLFCMHLNETTIFISVTFSALYANTRFCRREWLCLWRKKSYIGILRMVQKSHAWMHVDGLAFQVWNDTIFSGKSWDHSLPVSLFHGNQIIIFIKFHKINAQYTFPLYIVIKISFRHVV